MKIRTEFRRKNLFCSSFLVKKVSTTALSWDFVQTATLYNASGQLFLLDIPICSIPISAREYLFRKRQWKHSLEFKKNIFLKNSKNSKENVCTGISFFKLKAEGVFQWICKIFKNTTYLKYSQTCL